MAKHATNIGWTHLPEHCGTSWNPLRGKVGKWHCTKIRPGCAHCYSEELNRRFGGPPFRKGADDLRLDEKILRKPRGWTKRRAAFVCSMTDLFHPGVSFEWLWEIFEVMAAAEDHLFFILTKRIDRALDFSEWLHSDEAFVADSAISATLEQLTAIPNVWLGVTLENADYLDDLDKLYEIPAARRFVSFEPLLGEIATPFRCTHCDAPLDPFDSSWRHEARVKLAFGHKPSRWGHRCPGTHAQAGHPGGCFVPDWAIIGAESGLKRRPMRLGWMTELAHACKSAGLSVYIKQDGALTPAKQGRIPDYLWKMKEIPRR